uniref:Transmembrane protein 31 n=1 Tax=Chinchilla lanigera TaxID=34839 RepID=A0A8C2UI28_CHILA
MGLSNKNEEEQQPTRNNSDVPNEEQETQQPEEHTPVGQRTRRADTQPSRCRLPSRRTPAMFINRAVSLLGVLPWPIEWISSPYQLPAVFQFYPGAFAALKEAFQDLSQYLRAQIMKIGLPFILQFSALSALHFCLPFLPVLLFLSSFILVEFLLLPLILIILFILVFF